MISRPDSAGDGHQPLAASGLFAAKQAAAKWAADGIKKVPKLDIDVAKSIMGSLRDYRMAETFATKP